MEHTAVTSDAKAARRRMPNGRESLGQKDVSGQLEAHDVLKSDADLGALTLEFQDALKKSVEGFIEAGNVLIRAKQRLKHGQWEEWVIRKLRFGERARSGKAKVRKAQQLMFLARHSIISDPSKWCALPASIRKLNDLSDIPDNDLRELIATAVVHPGMTRKDVVQLKPGRQKSDKKEKPALTPTLRDEVKVLFHFCLNVGRPDVLRAYLRSLKSEPGLPSGEDFDRAVQFARQVYKTKGGR